MLFGHGDDFYNSVDEVKINFSSNVWYGTDLKELKLHLSNRLEDLACYPEPEAGSLKKLLANQTGLNEDNFVLTNGSVTAFYLLAQTWKGAKSLIGSPTFSEYEDACRLHEHEIRFYPSGNNISAPCLKGNKLCWICNPNNPDGKLMQRSTLLQLLSENRDIVFVVDQAYAAFCTEETLLPTDIRNHPNLIIVHSMTKVCKIPGIRIGYLIASEEITRRVNRYLIPWSVNSLAIEAGKFILTHPEQFTVPVCQWKEDTAVLIDRLNELKKVEALPTETTFFLVRLHKGTAAELKEFLLKQHGILIRNASNFHGLGNNYVRLSAQTPEENEILVKAVKEWLKTI